MVDLWSKWSIIIPFFLHSVFHCKEFKNTFIYVYLLITLKCPSRNRGTFPIDNSVHRYAKWTHQIFVTLMR